MTTLEPELKPPGDSEDTDKMVEEEDEDDEEDPIREVYEYVIQNSSITGDFMKAPKSLYSLIYSNHRYSGDIFCTYMHFICRNYFHFAIQMGIHMQIIFQTIIS